MPKRLCLVAALLASALFPAPHLFAQEPSNGTLHVVRPSINAEQDMAELCLEFDHPLDLTDRNRVIAGIRLQDEGKPVAVASANVSLSALSLCVQSLAHRDEYSLTVAGLRGAAGEKLNEPYKLSFTVPDRRPSLAFTGDPGGESFARIKDSDPVLHAINVARAKIGVFRIDDPARIAEAFAQRLQTTLAPSESLTFAKTNGRPVWQGEVVFDDSDDSATANQNIERPIPLHAISAMQAPGLYFVAATDEKPPARTKLDTDEIVPLAAQWFIRSDLRLRVLFKHDGLLGESEKADATAIMKDVRTIAFGRDYAILAEGKSDAAGQAFLPLAPDKIGDAATLVGITEAGDVDLADAASERSNSGRFTLSDLDAGLASDKPFYPAAADAFLTLSARDIHGQAMATAGSQVRLMRPDHSFFADLPVPDGKAGLSYLAFSAPPLNGLWTAVWRQPDGRDLAETTLRITSNPQAPRLTAAADRPLLGTDGDVSLTIKSTADNGTPAPYIPGHVLVQWKEPDMLAAFGDYHFGESDKTAGPPETVAAFITDSGGSASVHLALKSPDDSAPLHTAVVSFHADPASGALDPEPVALPVRPNNLVIGVRPSAPDGKFAENSLARFDIIAVDGDGKRREDSGLKYQIYEEGRSFAWYQDDGRWNYKPLQQRRRIGGGPLDIKTGGANVRWPVTAAAYALEITDVNGVVLTRYHFDAGWGFYKPGRIRPADLVLTASPNPAQPHLATTVTFTLAHPAVMTAVIADDHIRTVIHETRPEGANTIVFTPDESWGNRIRIRIEAAETGNATPIAGQIELPVVRRPEEFSLSTDSPSHIAGGQDFALAVTAANVESGKPTFVSLLATPRSAAGEDRLASILVPNVQTDSAGKAVLHFAVPRFDGNLSLAVRASNQSQAGRKELIIPVGAAIDGHTDVPAFMRLGDTVQLALDIENRTAPVGGYHYIVNAAPGLKLSGPSNGKLDLKTGERKSVMLDLAVNEAGARNITLDIFGPHNIRVNRVWTVTVMPANQTLKIVEQVEVAPQKTWTAPVRAKSKLKDDETTLFVASAPLFKAPAILPVFLEQVPFATGEMAAWLETARLWRDAMARAGLVPDEALRLRMNGMLKALLARQNADGSFPALAAGDGDPAGTADALVALARADFPSAKSAADAAAVWLQQRLSNTWFDESERPIRAAEFAALAAVDKADVSALRYFAETSDGKALPPLAMAQLAAALAKSNDRDKAGQWLKLLHDHVGDNPALLPVAAENPLVDSRDLQSALEKTAADILLHGSADPKAISAFLRAVSILNARAGGWRVAVNGVEKDQNGVVVVPSSAKPPATVIRNPSGHTIYLEAAEPNKNAPHGTDTAIARRFYKPDGAEIAPDQLRRGGVYLVRLEGHYPANRGAVQKLLVHDGGSAALRPITCMLDGRADVADAWKWLHAFALSPVSACETGPHGITALLDDSEEKSDKIWRAAYLAEAYRAGAFAMPAAIAGALGGKEWTTGADARIKSR